MRISDSERAEVAAVSARIGKDLSLIQGPGGNTSVKDESELWVKASGCWLADALDKPIFLGLDRQVIAGVADGYSVPEHAILAGYSSSTLRPSIETALHALMPQRVVIHAHAVNAMAISVLRDGEALASRYLADLNWGWIPYRRPGEPLARAVGEMIRATPRDILLLQNHGVVVGGRTATEAEELLAEVERRLEMPVRRFRRDAPSLPTSSVRFEPDAVAAPFALDPGSFAVLTGGALIPDQVVFLGGSVPAVSAGEDVDALADRLEVSSGVVPALVLSEGIGAFALRVRSPAATALIMGLLAIAERIPEGATIHTLATTDVTALLNWDAEKYRQRLNAADRR